MIVLVGIAFGADPQKQDIGDVLVASKVACYEPARVGNKSPIRRGPIVEPSLSLLDRFKNADGWTFARPDERQCEIRPGLVCSGEKLIDNARFKAQMLSDYPEAVGGEMEAAGLYAAADPEHVEWIVVKAICDWADGKKNKLHQPLAAAAAASLVKHVLASKDALAGISANEGRSRRVRRIGRQRGAAKTGAARKTGRGRGSAPMPQRAPPGKERPRGSKRARYRGHITVLPGG